MTLGSSAALDWLVKVFHEVMKYLERVAANLNDTIVYDPKPTAHTANTRALLQTPSSPQSQALRHPSENCRQRKPTSWDIRSTPPAMVSTPTAVLTTMPIPSNVKQTWALIARIGYS